MDAAGFDDWYANMARSDRLDAIVQSALGLPPEMESSSLLPWDGIADVADRLAIGPGDVFIDLACGRGGYGIEIARRTGARLIGVDFSVVAVGRARSRADIAAEFVVGSLTDTGLPGDSANAIVCVDAMQFASPYEAGLAECLRLLVPGGRLVMTGWEALDRTDPRLPERLRHDIGAALLAVGFGEVTVEDMPAWRAAERAQWEAAVAEDPAGDPAIESLHAEGEQVLPWLDHSRRVLASAIRPS